MRKVVVVAAAAVAVAAGILAARVLLASRSAWRAGEERVAEYNRLVGDAREGGDAAAGPDATGDRRAALLRDAVLSFREAASWYMPGNPFVGRAVARLITIGQKAEQAGDDATALFAYRAARSSVLSVRGASVRREEDLEQADRAIARVSARVDRPEGGGTEAEPFPARERRHLARLEDLPGPDPWWSLAAAGGLLAWTGGAAAFALRGFDREGRIRAGAAVRCLLVVAAGLAAWAGGLAMA